MQALSRELADDLQARFQGFLAPEAKPAPRQTQGDVVALGPLRGSLPAGAPPENVVRSVDFRRDAETSPSRRRSDVTSAVDTVVKAAAALREAEQEAEEKTQRALSLAFRTITQLEKAEGQLRAAEERIEELGPGAEAAQAAVARLARTERTLAASTEQVRGLEGQVADLQAALAAAETRAQSAELLAAEAQADVRYLADKVSEVLGGRG